MSMSKEIKKLTNQRKGYQLNAGRHIKSATELVAAELNSDTADQLAITIESLREYQIKIENLNSQILDSLDDDEQLVQEAVDSAAYFETILFAIKSAEHKISKFHNAPKSEIDDDNASCRSAASSSRKAASKLPKLEITPFDGDPIKWQEFWDTFQTTIDNNPDLEDIDKLKYLKKYIVGDAINVIDSFRVTSANYKVIVDSLKERYGNPEIAIHAHFEKLLALPSSQNDSLKLQKVYDECEKHIRSLVALGLEEDTFGKVFTPIILSKLPANVRVQICRSNGSQPWELCRLRSLMREEINAREMSNRYSETGKDLHETKGEQKKQKPPPPTQSLLYHQASEPKTKVVCNYCGNNHYADQCNVYTTVDQRKEKLDGRCLRCLSSDHRLRECPSKSGCYYCKRDNHHSSLCFSKFGDKSKPKSSTTFNSNKNNSDPKAPITNDSAMMQTGHQVQMQMATVQFPGTNVEARIFFDSGSSRTYITERLANALGLSCFGRETIISTKFGNKHRKTEDFAKANIFVPTLNGTDVPVSALVTPHICCPIAKYPISVEDNPVLKNLPLADMLSDEVQHVEIDMLVGQDYCFDFIGTERLCLKNGMFLINSKLGYLLTGKVPTVDSDSQSSSVLMFCQATSHNEQLGKFWSLEDIGVKDSPYDKDDEVALEQFNNTICFSAVDRRYEVTWPWKPARPELPTNYGLAFGSLKSLVSRIGKQPEVMALYDATIQDQLNKQVTEIVDDSSESTENIVHYIPHHAVIRKDKATTKLRIVYNASAKCGKDKASLNDCLLRGPVFLSDIVGMLIRFRLHSIGISSDIEKAFLQVQLQESQRDCTRFLWLKDTSEPVTSENLITIRFRRVPFGVKSSPFLLQGTVKHHLQDDSSDVASDIDKNMYVDNVFGGVASVDEAVSYYQESKLIFSKISMNLREWYSNSKEFIRQVAPNDIGKDQVPKVLGLTWNTDTDTLSCNSFKQCDDFSSLTKRKMLQSISTMYDPCGFFAPIVVRGKIMIQELWIQNIPWDSPVPKEFVNRFRDLTKDLQGIHEVRLPRILNDASAVDVSQNELHCFCDASKSAYATTIYLRTETTKGIRTSLVLSKTRVAPIKSISLPRLELMAVVIGVRSVDYIRREIKIPISQTIVWSDSKCVLHWIHSRKVLTTFVQNRVNEIKNHPFEFRYIQTSINPADIPSRGAELNELMDNSLWWHGPNFLSHKQSMWPENEFEVPEIVSTEERAIVMLATVATSPIGIGSVVDISRFSSMSRLLRVTCWVLRFIGKCRLKSAGNSSLVYFEMADSRLKWIKYVQKSITSDNCVSKQLKRFGVFRDDTGLLRCRGRLQNSSLPINEIDQILLPKNNEFSKLAITECHERLFHSGIRHTLAEFRYEFWIPQGRSQVNKVIRQCIICRKVEGGPFKVPESPALPSFRVCRSHPFSAIGVDYLGPLIVRPNVDDDDSEIKTFKVWIALFTCAATRAIHLEVVNSCNTEDFILSFRRFIGFYGCPKLVVSDNAKHFKASFDVIHQIFQSSDVKDFASSRGIDWKFIPALAPWMGGFYERLVGSVKRSLRKVLQKKCLRLIQIQTVVVEVSAVINSRPLVPVDLETGEMALTPSHFLSKSGRVGLPVSAVKNDDGTFDQYNRKTELLKSWFKGQKLLDQFWNSWHKEYLASLKDRPIVNMNARNSSDLQVKPGVVVLIQEPQPRACWRMAKVVELQVGNDEKVRSALIQLSNGRKIVRPLKLLHPIEDSADTEQLAEKTDNTSKIQRKAAIQAKSAICKQLQAEETDSESESDL